MASTSLQAESAQTKAAPDLIYHLATELQVLCSRVRSLAQAVDTAADEAFSEERKDVRGRNIQNVINFANLIEREVDEIASQGEQIEILSRSVTSADGEQGE